MPEKYKGRELEISVRDDTLDRLIHASQSLFENSSKISQVHMYNMIYTLLIIVVFEIIFKIITRKASNIQSGDIMK